MSVSCTILFHFFSASLSLPESRLEVCSWWAKEQNIRQNILCLSKLEYFRNQFRKIFWKLIRGKSIFHSSLLCAIRFYTLYPIVYLRILDQIPFSGKYMKNQFFQFFVTHTLISFASCDNIMETNWFLSNEMIVNENEIENLK